MAGPRPAMSETDLGARLDAVERALTDDDTDIEGVRETAEFAATIEDLESRIADLEERVDELDAGLQAVRGYAGNVRAVNRDVERRASAALAKAETLESSVEVNTPSTVDLGERSTTRPDASDRLPDERERRPNRTDDRQGRVTRRAGTDGERDRECEGRPPSKSDARRASTDAAAGPRSESDSGTERFVERVRDAL